MKALVTGGAGFIGSHVVDLLLKEGIEPYVLVSGTRSNKHPNIINEDARVFHGNLRSLSDMRGVTKGMTSVFHLGAMLSHYCEQFPELAIDTNVKGTWNLKRACAENGVEQIIFASTSFVYGDHDISVFNETVRTRPKGLFGVTKLAAEKLLQATHPCEVPYTILRLFNVYGPRSFQDRLYTAVIPTWINKALNQAPLEIHAAGTHELDFVFVEDVAEAFIKCINPTSAENQVFNVGSGIATSMNYLATLINKLTSNEKLPYYNTGHPPYFKHVQADFNKIYDSVRWRPKTSLEKGIEKTIKFFKELRQ